MSTAKRRRQAKASFGFGLATFALGLIAVLGTALVLPLAALSAVASVVYGAFAIRAPRTWDTTALVAIGFALVSVPVAAVAVIAYELATGGLE